MGKVDRNLESLPPVKLILVPPLNRAYLCAQLLSDNRVLYISLRGKGLLPFHLNYKHILVFFIPGFITNIQNIMHIFYILPNFHQIPHYLYSIFIIYNIIQLYNISPVPTSEKDDLFEITNYSDIYLFISKVWKRIFFSH